MTYEKIEATQSVPVSIEQFATRRYEFKFSPPADTWWIPSRSFFRVRVRAQAVAQADAIGSIADLKALTDQGTATFNLGVYNPLVPAMAFGDQMFQSARFHIGSTEVCSVSNNYQQVAIMNKRLNRSKIQLDQDSGLYQADYYDRISMWNGRQGDPTAFQHERELVGQKYAQATQATDGTYGGGASKYEFLYNPPLPIVDVDHAMPASAYTFHLQGNPQAATDMIETLRPKIFHVGGATGTAAKEKGSESKRSETVCFPAEAFRAEIDEIELVYYACLVRGPDGSDAKFALNLQDLQCQSVQLPAGVTTVDSGENKGVTRQNINFNVHQDTTALALAFQGTPEHNGENMGKCSFTGSGQTETDTKYLGRGIRLDQWYIQYDGRMYPPEQNEDRFNLLQGDNYENLAAHRYHDTLTQTGQIWESGGAESFSDFMLKRGAYYYVNWPRTMSTASRVTVNALLSGLTQTHVLLFTKTQQSFLIRTSDARVRRVEANE